MTKLIECVPNISCGNNPHIINTIADAITSVPGITLMHMDVGKSVNRTVYSFIGPSNAVYTAAIATIRMAYNLIDMRDQTGTHSRLGACDVCPFIPFAEATMSDCTQLAHRVAKQVADKLNIPVYLYAHAAQKNNRISLPIIRNGQYEGLARKLSDPAWQPDYGPCAINPQFGAISIGARNIMLAYNINLNTTDVAIAKRIASQIRESGHGINTPVPQEIKDLPPKDATHYGQFNGVQATGWHIPEYNCAQITMNIHNIATSKLYIIYETCRLLAESYGYHVTGSEIIGMVPKSVLIDAGRFFAPTQCVNNDAEFIDIACNELNLNDKNVFNPDTRIIDYMISDLSR